MVLTRQSQLWEKYFSLLNHDNITPLCYLVCDSNQISFVLTVYSINNDAGHIKVKRLTSLASSLTEVRLTRRTRGPPLIICWMILTRQSHLWEKYFSLLNHDNITPL